MTLLVILAMPLAAVVGDKWLPRRTWIALSIFLLALATWPLHEWMLASGGSLVSVLMAHVLTFLLLAVPLGSGPALFVELFPERDRLSGYSVAFNLETAVGRPPGGVPRGGWQGTTRRNSDSIPTSCNAARRCAGRALVVVAAFTRKVTPNEAHNHQEIRRLRRLRSGQPPFLGSTSGWEPDTSPTAEQWVELKDMLSNHPARWIIWEGTPDQH